MGREIGASIVLFRMTQEPRVRIQLLEGEVEGRAAGHRDGQCLLCVVCPQGQVYVFLCVCVLPCGCWVDGQVDVQQPSALLDGRWDTGPSWRKWLGGTCADWAKLRGGTGETDSSLCLRSYGFSARLTLTVW